MPRKILLNFFQSPGDTLVATGSVECLKKQFPETEIQVKGTCVDAIFANSPHISNAQDGYEIKMHQPLVNHCDDWPVHMLSSYCHHLSSVLKVHLPCTVNRPYLYIAEEEKTPYLPKGWTKPYWVINSGGKSDYTVKVWHGYQEVVDSLQGEVMFVQVGEAGHNHTPLKHCLNLLGKTSTRELIRLCYHAEGGIGGESFLNHIFAAFQKPMVCLCSGFCPVHFISYPTGCYLHRSGMLPCNRTRACWKARVLPLPDKSKHNRSLCVLPVDGQPKCLAMIPPEEAVQAIRNYRTSITP